MYIVPPNQQIGLFQSEFTRSSERPLAKVRAFPDHTFYIKLYTFKFYIIAKVRTFPEQAPHGILRQTRST